MTHMRRPNRRRVPELAEIANGGSCRRTRKVRYLDERGARTALTQIATHDPEAARLDVYSCGSCGDWHVGHRSES